MAKLYPSYNIIEQQKVPPTPGEKNLLDFLVQNLDDTFEVFYQPFLNGDQPDIIVMKENAGVVIIEVKDWSLNHYYLDGKNNWFLMKNDAIIDSPLWQVQKYKDNLYNLHSEALFEKSINDKRAWSVVNCMVYFHNATEDGVNQFLRSGENQDYRYKNFLNYMTFWGNDSLSAASLDRMIRKFRLHRDSFIFDEPTYQSCLRYFNPPYHELEDGKKITYTKAQSELIRSETRPYRKIKGAAGSGKTLVLAKRAVNAHKRTGNRVLVLTFNLSLKNYIHDRISDVREGFYWDNFYITNYHQFFKAQANNHNLKITSLACWQDRSFFDQVKDSLEKYDAIFIDEIQDYQQPWLDMITENFMHEDTEFVVFGDEKQNIYERKLSEDNEIVVRKIPGLWNKSMNVSHRFGSDIGKIALNFQTNFFDNKYKADDLNFLSQIDFEQRVIKNIAVSDASAQGCLTEIFNIIEKHSIHSSNVGILGTSVEKLRELDNLIKSKKKEKTAITFETLEEYEIIKKKKMVFLKNRGIVEDVINKTIEKEIHSDLEKIRRLRKNNFWMKTGTIKLSTIHSFKGWEIDTLFLLIENDENSQANAELIYTGLTRARKNLIVLNLGNPKYQTFFQSQLTNLGI